MNRGCGTPGSLRRAVARFLQGHASQKKTGIGVAPRRIRTAGFLSVARTGVDAPTWADKCVRSQALERQDMRRILPCSNSLNAKLRLSPTQVRRLAIMGQRLSAPRPRSIEEVVRDLWSVQLDPTRAVARTEHLVLWSRLGRVFRVSDLQRLLWDERGLFEYWAHIVPTSDFSIHRETMRRYPTGAWGDSSRARYVQYWLTVNAAFRRYVLRELRRRGPLRAKDLEDRAVLAWRTGGWNDGTHGSSARNVSMMLDRLWFKGEIMIVGRDGQQRIWDLAERSLPVDEPRPRPAQVALEIMGRQLHAAGVARLNQFGFAFDGRPPGWNHALSQLIKQGIAVPVDAVGFHGEWYAHADLLGRTFRPRTVLLSPFDDLIANRTRTEQLFAFRFRLEIYVPQAKRQFGYFVMPVLQGDRLIGRIDPLFDRDQRVLRVQSVHGETDARQADGSAVADAIDELASWLGAEKVTFGRTMPSAWRRKLGA